MKRRLIALAMALGLIAAITTTSAGAGLLSPPSSGWTCKNGYVSVSFDDGPTANTKSLLAALNKEDIRATFFVVGTQIENDPTLLTNIVTGGNSVQNHSWQHQDFAPLDQTTALVDLAKTQGLITGLTRVQPQFFRPPYGNMSEETAGAETTLGLTEVVWTIDTLDWDGRSAQSIADATKTAKAGDFILMHDGYKNTVSAIPQIAKNLKANGLCAGKIVTSDIPTNAWWGRNFDASVSSW